MKRIILNIDEDYSEQFDVLDCEYEKLLLISISYPCIEINLVREIRIRTSKDILKVINWIEKMYYNEDKIYKYLINSLIEANKKKFGTYGARKPINKNK